MLPVLGQDILQDLVGSGKVLGGQYFIRCYVCRCMRLRTHMAQSWLPSASAATSSQLPQRPSRLTKPDGQFRLVRSCSLHICEEVDSSTVLEHVLVACPGLQCRDGPSMTCLIWSHHLRCGDVHCRCHAGGSPFSR